MFEGATFPSNKPCVCKAKNRGSFSHKSHKNRGHLGTFFSNSSRLGVFERKISKILDSVKKIGLWVTIFGKNRGFGLMLGGENKECVAVGAYHCLYGSDSPIGLVFLVLELGP